MLLLAAGSLGGSLVHIRVELEVVGLVERHHIGVLSHGNPHGDSLHIDTQQGAQVGIYIAIVLLDFLSLFTILLEPQSRTVASKLVLEGVELL